MYRKLLIALCGAALAVLAPTASGALASGTGTKVSVRVEGLNKTLLAPKRVHAPSSGSITKGGTPAGKCPATSAAGALDVATKHNWTGTYNAKYSDLEITKILGEAHSFSSSNFWEIFVNNVAASTGVCGITLHKGDQLLFAAVPDKGTEYPLGDSVPKSVKVGHTLKIKVVGYDAAGKSKPLGSATVEIGSATVKTNTHGVARIKPTKTGKLVVQASKAGYIRAAPVSVHVTP
jgi:hypothetical protein